MTIKYILKGRESCHCQKLISLSNKCRVKQWKFDLKISFMNLHRQKSRACASNWEEYFITNSINSIMKYVLHWDAAINFCFTDFSKLFVHTISYTIEFSLVWWYMLIFNAFSVRCENQFDFLLSKYYVWNMFEIRYKI